MKVFDETEMNWELSQNIAVQHQRLETTMKTCKTYLHYLIPSTVSYGDRDVDQFIEANVQPAEMWNTRENPVWDNFERETRESESRYLVLVLQAVLGGEMAASGQPESA